MKYLKYIFIVFAYLGISLTADAQHIERSETCFTPSEHGWKFDNGFDYHPIIRILGADFYLNQSVGRGLCGGMCFSALDRYYRGEPIPNITSTPTIEDGLGRYITNRQQTSVKSGVVAAKVLDWILRPDQANPPFGRHSVGYYTKQQIARMKTKIKEGKPVTLVLVRGKGASELNAVISSHQVVAYKYEDNHTNKVIRIWIYDPNDSEESEFGDENRIIKVKYGFDRNKIIVTYDGPGPDHEERGFFINDYDKTESPENSLETTCGTVRFSNAKRTLIASPTGCSSNVPTDEPSYWYAGEEIIFKPGFTAFIGSDFSAYINSCHLRFEPVNLAAIDEDGIENSSFNNIDTRSNVSLSNPTVSDFNLYPNPSMGNSALRFKLENASNVVIRIYNAQGMLIEKKEWHYESGTYELILNENANWSTGTYFVSLQTNGKTISKPLIISK